MNKNSVITVILLLFYFSGYAQQVKSLQNPMQNQKNQSSESKYSSDKLWNASPEDLNLYLKKAKGLKTTGLVMTIAGPVITGVGVGMIAGWDERGIGLFFTGLGVTAVGIPVWISGSRRFKKVKHAIETHNGVSFNIAPGFVSSNQNLYPGVSLRVRF